MRNMKQVLLGIVVLTVALTAAPAAAERGRGEGFRGHREARQERHEGREHERWEHRGSGFFFPVPYAAPFCYPQHGYWAWNGWQYVWVPPQMVCR